MNNLSFSHLLNEAVSKPGIISQAYSAFHNYSLGNQIAATVQLGDRIGPIASYKSWQEKGRQVKKGAKAIALCMPVTMKVDKKDGSGEKDTFSRFIWKNNWFVLSDTEGTEFAQELVIPAWNKGKALQNLDITQIDFAIADGNCQGYATSRNIAISPVAALPHKTTFHELAHVVLGHTTESRMSDSDTTPRDIREVEAESVAYILCSILGLPGLNESRGYIQSWLSGAEVGEKSAQKIYSTSDKILKAGA